MDLEHFEGHQKEPWSHIFTHDLFAPDELVPELLEIAPEGLNKLFDLYVERSSTLYASAEIGTWLKELAGFLCNELNTSLDRESTISYVLSVVHLPFRLDRYTTLSKEYFSDDVTTIAPEELMPEGQAQP
jgi:hypothetical protein